MKGAHFLSLSAVAILAMASSVASAYDSSPLQDFCVATDKKFRQAGFVNGKFCKNPKQVTVEDFSASGFNIPGNTNNSVGSNVNLADVQRFPGLNTMGVSLARIDYAPNGGQNPPHVHPRGSELLSVARGTLSVGFISSSQDNRRLFNKTLNQGDIFVFPIGMIHFEVNIGSTPAIAFTVLNSQNPGVITIVDSVFGSQPSINPDFLAKAFKLNRSVVINLQKLFGSKTILTSKKYYD